MVLKHLPVTFEADIENGDPLQCKQLSKFTSNPNSSTSRSTWYIFQPYSNYTIVFIFLITLWKEIQYITILFHLSFKGNQPLWYHWSPFNCWAPCWFLLFWTTKWISIIDQRREDIKLYGLKADCTKRKPLLTVFNFSYIPGKQFRTIDKFKLQFYGIHIWKLYKILAYAS